MMPIKNIIEKDKAYVSKYIAGRKMCAVFAVNQLLIIKIKAKLLRNVISPYLNIQDGKIYNVDNPSK